jgi:hypothetical protein
MIRMESRDVMMAVKDTRFSEKNMNEESVTLASVA